MSRQRHIRKRQVPEEDETDSSALESEELRCSIYAFELFCLNRLADLDLDRVCRRKLEATRDLQKLRQKGQVRAVCVALPLLV